MTTIDAQSARPVAATERMEVLDVLRGVAVYGILLYNALAFSGYDFLSPAEQRALPLASLNRIGSFLVEFLIAGKFYSLFSFMFGVGFSIFIQRATVRGARAVALFKRRLAGLLLIGLVHTTFIWAGDILTTYAVLGFALIPFLNRDDRAVLRWAWIWVLAPIPIYVLLLALTQLVAPSPAGDAPLPAVLQRALGAFAHGTYPAVVRGNLVFTAAGFIRRVALMFFPRVFGMFLLGLYAGRHNMFASAGEHRVLLTRTLVWGAAIGLPLAFAGPFLGDSGAPRLPTPMGLLYMTVETIATPALALAYGAAVCLAFMRYPRLLAAFAPVGRMALTNYLMHSIVGVTLFYGIGFQLWGRVGPAVLLPGATALVLIQVAVSRWWLSRAAFGPAEWIWRTLTYGQRVPLMKARHAATT